VKNFRFTTRFLKSLQACAKSQQKPGQTASVPSDFFFH